MEFSIILYESASGGSPVEEFLAELKQSDPRDHAAVLRHMQRLQESRNHGEPLTKPLGGGLLELRILGKLNTRMIWFFRRGRQIIIVHGVRNKGTKLLRKDLELARSRMLDWKERHGDGQD